MNKFVYKIVYRMEGSKERIVDVAKNDGALSEVLNKIAIKSRNVSCTKIYEKFKDVEGYNGRYQISNFGRIKSIAGNESVILKQSVNHNGYLTVGIYDSNINQKTHKVHRLVGAAFLSNEKNLPEIDHLRGDKQCNYYFMLEWVTHQQNIERALSKPVLQVFKNGNIKKVFKSAIEAQNKGFMASHISECCNGKRKTHGGFLWRMA